MSNALYNKLGNSKFSHSLTLDIYRPNGSLYISFGTDTATGQGDFSSLPTSKALDKVQSSVTAILNVALPDRLILSRQMISWRGVISCISSDAIAPTTLVLFEGIISNCNTKGVYTSIELISKTGLLNSQPPIILSNNCPLIFGSTECSVVKTSVWVQPLALTGYNFTLPVTAYATNPAFKYVAVIGDVSYVINSFTVPSAGNINAMNMENVPLALPDWVLISTSCNQTITQCRIYGNTPRFRGSVLPRNPLSFN